MGRLVRGEACSNGGVKFSPKMIKSSMALLAALPTTYSTYHQNHFYHSPDTGGAELIFHHDHSDKWL